MAIKGAPKKRRLSDLFQVGRDVEINDGENEPISIFLRKPNPFEHEEALKDGNAARARMTLKMRDPKMSEYDILKADVEALGNQRQQVDFLMSDRRSEFLGRAYAKISNLPEWEEDGLIDALQTNIEQYSQREEEVTEDDEDWGDYQRVKEQVEKFNAQVEKAADDIQEEEIKEAVEEDPEVIREKVRRSLIDKAASLLFFREYRLSCLYFAVREPEAHATRYFTSKQEVRELPYEVQRLLLDAYEELDLSREDAKNSLSAAPSSLESAPSNSPETSEPSGPAELID